MLDNTPYRNVVGDRAPNSGNTKQEIKEWLTFHLVMMLIPTFYEIIKRNKPIKKINEIDPILKQHKHLSLWLPLYHPDLNPIKMFGDL